jgi:hypothetical protein
LWWSGGGIGRTNFLAGATNGEVVLVKDNADLVHEADLLFIVAVEVVVLSGRSGIGQGGVDLREETEDVFGGDLRRLGDGGSSSGHDGEGGLGVLEVVDWSRQRQGENKAGASMWNLGDPERMGPQ